MTSKCRRSSEQKHGPQNFAVPSPTIAGTKGNSGGSGTPDEGRQYSMNTQLKGKLRPLLVFVTLMFAISALTEQTFAQRLPEAACGPSVAWRAPMCTDYCYGTARAEV